MKADTSDFADCRLQITEYSALEALRDGPAQRLVDTGSLTCSRCICVSNGLLSTTCKTRYTPRRGYNPMVGIDISVYFSIVLATTHQHGASMNSSEVRNPIVAICQERSSTTLCLPYINQTSQCLVYTGFDTLVCSTLLWQGCQFIILCTRMATNIYTLPTLSRLLHFYQSGINRLQMVLKKLPLLHLLFAETFARCGVQWTLPTGAYSR
jgi:hypothetical protein